MILSDSQNLLIARRAILFHKKYKRASQGYSLQTGKDIRRYTPLTLDINLRAYAEDFNVGFRLRLFFTNLLLGQRKRERERGSSSSRTTNGAHPLYKSQWNARLIILAGTRVIATGVSARIYPCRSARSAGSAARCRTLSPSYVCLHFVSIFSFRSPPRFVAVCNPVQSRCFFATGNGIYCRYAGYRRDAWCDLKSCATRNYTFLFAEIVFTEPTKVVLSFGWGKHHHLHGLFSKLMIATLDLLWRAYWTMRFRRREF